MIIGNGLIAKALHPVDLPNVLYFASGVSNSLEAERDAFQREYDLLRNSAAKFPEAKLVYFSTLSILDQTKKDSPYIFHKLKIEEYIVKNCKNFVILRIGNIVGSGGNPNTLFNFLKNKINTQQEFRLHQKARRYLVDIEDVVSFLTNNLDIFNKEIISFAYPDAYTLTQILHGIEERFQKRAKCVLVEDGDYYPVKFNDKITNYFSSKSKEEYLKILAVKYI